ncbi:FAD/FMN-containing dehydrogenase [Lentibacillus saliphilus]|uniref:FAD/FMN-containing dehydrogenase n=1 Tax=Lentibacillus saliphilus TaxID=2737028 RepID=UPI001C2F2B93|nr:FAD/FMN-containing dehydrogenase [Lentibacillus saliphilus]
MKKKVTALVFTSLLLFGMGGIVFAHDDTSNESNRSNDDWGYEEMVPFMKDVHPNLSDEQFEQMYEFCH